MIKKYFAGMSKTQYIALGFFLIIMAGTILLLLPVSTSSGETTDLLTAAFTATSAGCVTGLVVVDTYTHWSVFGQIVILLLIQVGGLGFMSIGVMFTMFLKRKINLRMRGMLKESINVLEVGGIVKLVKKIIKGTLIIEGAGALLLSTRFIPQMGFLRGIYYAIFHAISAFCNAGFDLIGYKEEYCSFVPYSDDIVVNITLIVLIIIGGIGFIVWDDITKKGFHFRKYMLHTKLVLVTSAVLVFAGAVLFFIFERNNQMSGMSASETALTSLFASVTARTAGMNTIDVGAMTNSSKLLTMLLMFIGGSPGSTAGGVKTVTITVLMLYVWTNLRNNPGCNAFKRRIGDEEIKKAGTVLLISLFMVITASVLICAIEPLGMSDVLFEVFSAIGTVGMSTGITRALGTGSRIVIILLMYCGRIGSMSFAMSFTEKKKVPPVQLPEERVIVG